MALVNVPGGFLIPIGPGWATTQTLPANNSTTLDAANEAIIYIGQAATSDGGSHTLDTTGSSSIGWRSGAVTFANAATTLKVGVGAVITTAGPPARAANAADVITFDVNAALTGGGGGVTANAWQTTVPTTGTKTIAHGDLVAVSIQMTARGGVDSVVAQHSSAAGSHHNPQVTSFTGASYTNVQSLPNVFITFSDGATGWIYGSEIFSTINTRTWNSGSATKEYGQLYNLPFPMKIYGLFGYLDPDADCDVVLYSDPLGTPVVEKTFSFDSNVTVGTFPRRFTTLFATPYTTTSNQNIGAVFKPGASSVSVNYRTIANAAQRVTDPYGTSGYGIGRASGAFATENTNLDHYYIGLLVGGFDAGGSGGISRARAASGF